MVLTTRGFFIYLPGMNFPFQSDFVPRREVVYLLFTDHDDETEILLSVHKTPEGAMNEGNIFLHGNGSTERFGCIEDLPRTKEGNLVYIQVSNLED